MSMSPGTRFGDHEVAALIGVGGVGEVYRATDTSLKRNVALKVLPETFAGNSDRLAKPPPTTIFCSLSLVPTLGSYRQSRHIGGGGEGVLPSFVSLIRGYAVSRNLEQIEWLE